MLVAPLVFQDKVDAPPVVTFAGLATKDEIVGAGIGAGGGGGGGGVPELEALKAVINEKIR
jgi:hypothetical protein